jgi:capsid protein
MLAEWRAGTRTLESICLETGDDWKEVVTQKGREIAFIQSKADEFKIEPNDLSDAIAVVVAPPIPIQTPPQRQNS